MTTRIEEGDVTVQIPRLERRIAQLEQTSSRLVSALLFGVPLIGGILLRPNDEVLGAWLITGSGLPLLHAEFAGVLVRRGPLP